ncbi:MAG: hypothetical protein ACYS0K_20535, partial [Planctomycetota bacterium]
MSTLARRALVWFVALAGCTVAGSAAPEAAAPRPAADPRQGAVPLPAEEGWRAQLVIDQGDVGIWTVKAFPIFDSVGSDELVALDDSGRCLILIPYSGRWTTLECIHEGAWL